jgi:hypothetical protein
VRERHQAPDGADERRRAQGAGRLSGDQVQAGQSLPSYRATQEWAHPEGVAAIATAPESAATRGSMRPARQCPTAANRLVAPTMARLIASAFLGAEPEYVDQDRDGQDRISPEISGSGLAEADSCTGRFRDRSALTGAESAADAERSAADSTLRWARAAGCRGAGRGGAAARDHFGVDYERLTARDFRRTVEGAPQHEVQC